MASTTSFPVTERDILHSNTTRYMILNFNGEGCFGKVAQCLDLIKGNMVAVKIHKKSRSQSIRDELSMLSAIRHIDPDKNNIVKFMEYFRFNNLSCLAFEMLDKSLWDLMKERKWKGLSLNQIRPVTQQLLVALKALKENGIMHTDLKPDNVMLVNHQNQPFKIKLIDFGLARPVNQAEVGMLMQACAYRAPEVTLGLPLSESVDMWGVGCIMAFLYFGVNLFPRDCEYNRMKLMLHLLGEPDGRLLDIGRYSKYYFTIAHNFDWRFRTPEEYTKMTGKKPNTGKWYFDCNQTLEDIIRSYPRKSVFEFKDRMAFSDLMISCLHPNYDDRTTPTEALKHEFVTAVHLVGIEGSETYIDSALDFMGLTQHSYETEDDRRRVNTFSTLSSVDVQIMESSTTGIGSSSGYDASLDEDGKESEDEAESYLEHLDENDDSLLLSPGDSQIMESSTTGIGSSSGYDASLDEDGEESEDEEHCVPVKCGCGQTYSGPEDEKEGYPEHLDDSENNCSCEEPKLSSPPLSPGEIQIMESSTTDTDSSSGTDASLHEDGKKPENEEQCAPMKCGCGQSYTSNHDSYPSSPGNDDINPNKSRGPVEQDQQTTTDTATPPREEPGTSACHYSVHVNYLPVGRNDRPSDIVPNGGAAASSSSSHAAAASISSNHGNKTSLLSNNGTTAPVGSEEPHNIETAPVTTRRKTVRQRINSFFRRVRKLFHR